TNRLKRLRYRNPDQSNTPLLLRKASRKSKWPWRRQTNIVHRDEISMLRRIRAGHQANCRLTVYLQILGPNDKQLWSRFSEAFLTMEDMLTIVRSCDRSKPAKDS